MRIRNLLPYLLCPVLLTLTETKAGFARETPWKGPSVDLSHGRLQVSPNGRYLQHEDGTPFFYLGDTAWELFHRLDAEETEQYLENRRAKGFTVIQAVLLPEMDGLRVPNIRGDLPLAEGNPLRPNEAYFKWVDTVIRMAEKKSMYIGLLPTWGDKVDRRWGTGPEIFDVETATRYATWLGERYRSFRNIIWINGGDRPGGEDKFAVWDAMGKALRAADPNHLITFHPSGESSSSQWFHHCEWLDFNMAQTSHCQRNYAIFERIIGRDYGLTPVKPCMDGEPRYENHPVCWQPEEQGWFDDTDVRQALYWSLFSGAFGHTYGCHDIWQMATHERESAGFARGEWKVSMNLPGAGDMIHARRLIGRFDRNTRPAPEIVVSENNTPDHRITALKGDGFALVYFPNGETATLDFSETGNGRLRLEWLDPRTGRTVSKTKIAASSAVNVIPSGSGKGNDWVLIVWRQPLN